MKYKKFLCILLLATLGFSTIGTLFSYPAWSSHHESFSFAFFTDPHVGSGLGNKNMPLVVKDILENQSNLAFAVNGGDITELGMPNQYQEYLQMIKPLTMPIYHTLGNHESRWSDAGKGIFKSFFGELYSSWDYQGVHFIILDTSIARGQHGHLEKKMLEWLKQDLASTGKTKPIIIFGHHPIFFDESKDESKFLDNDWELYPIIKEYNVSAIFTGHGHRDDRWVVNGINVFMTKAVMGDGYAIVEINQQKGELSLITRTPSQQSSKPYVTIPLKKGINQPQVNIAGSTQNALHNSNFDLKVRLTNWSSAPIRMEYKLEDNSWKPLEMVNGEYVKNIDISTIDDGIRNIWVRAIDNEWKVYLDRLQFRLAKSDKVKINWEFTTSGGVQSTPLVYGRNIFFGDNSGKVYSLDQATGKKVWEYQTEGAIIDSPSVADGKIYISSADGKIYCLYASNGQKVWEYQTGGSLVAQPLIADGKIFVGSADFNMYALDAINGKLIWKLATSNLINSQGAYGEGLVFFGSWDRFFYAVDAMTGEMKWKKELGSQIYYAPATSTPIYYDGKVFVSTPGSRVFAFEASTGKDLWEIKESSGLSSPIIFNQALVYSNLGGLIYALDPETGEKVWQEKSGVSGYLSSPVAHGGNIIYAGLNSKLASINTSENPVNWAIKLGESYTFNKVATSNNYIFVGTLEGKVYCLVANAGVNPKPFPMGDLFTDIGEHWARRQLNSLAKLGLIQGFNDGTFRPYEPITRGQLAVVLSRHVKYETPSTEFLTKLDDLKDYWAKSFILAMEEKGIVSGYQVDGGKLIFKPDNKVKRSEAIVMLARAVGLTKPTEGFVTKLLDIDNHWAKDYIMALEEKGYISGYLENGKLIFNPEKEINRGEMGVILVRSLGK